MKVISVMSGGLDSAVMTGALLANHQMQVSNVIALTIDYGQRHKREIEAAKNIAALLGIRHHIVDLSGLASVMKGSSQTDSSVPVPHGHYTGENMKLTVVPNRNMILLAVAGALAISEKADRVYYAAHAGDHAIYPDCREEFVEHLSQALWNADNHHVKIARPFIASTKAQIVILGAGNDNHEIMAISYSCYEGNELHCGVCGTCQERRVAFRDAGIRDQTRYNPLGLQEVPDSALVS